MTPILAGCLLVMTAKTAVTAPAASQTDSILVSVRVRYDSASCPVAAQVYLEETTDTIAGFELSLMWERPDVMAFEVVRKAVPSLAGDTAHVMPESVQSNKLLLDSSLTRNWRYLEGRTDGGHRLKVTAIASLLERADSLLILPGTRGLLFETLLSPVPPQGSGDMPDSVGLHIVPGLTRFSSVSGELIGGVKLESTLVTLKSCIAHHPR